jgi:ankyrin repeat protein
MTMNFLKLYTILALSTLAMSPSFAQTDEEHRDEILASMNSSHVNINAPIDEYGTRPLHEAVSLNHPLTTRLLLSRGAHVNAQMTNGEAPLHLAAQLGNTVLTTLLLEDGAFVFIRDIHGATPLHHAAQGGMNTPAESQITVGDKIPLRGWISAHCNDYFHAIDLEETLYNYPQTMKLLINAAASTGDADTLVNAKTKNEWTALHFVACTGFLALAHILLDAHAGANLETNKGWTPLHLAQSSLSREELSHLLEPMINLLWEHSSYLNQALYNTCPTWQIGSMFSDMPVVY